MNITSIPELIKLYGSIVNAHRVTGLSELTISKFRYDVKMEYHVILNDRLMTATATSRPINRDAENPVHEKRSERLKRKRNGIHGNS